MTTAEGRKAGARPNRRSAARLAAVQALYQIEMTHGRISAVVDEFARHRLGQDIDGDAYVAPTRELFDDLVKGTASRLEEVDALIGKALTSDWPLDRLETVLRAILRVGAYELLARLDTPARVVISEYLDVAHAFYSGKEPGFVNGVLDRLARILRATELDTTVPPPDLGEPV